MSARRPLPQFSRRDFLKVGGGAVAGSFVISAGLNRLFHAPLHAEAATRVARVAAAAAPTKQIHVVCSDAWVSMPDNAPPVPPWWPDPLGASAPQGAPRNMYIFGFLDVTGLPQASGATFQPSVNGQKYNAQLASPTLWFDEGTDLVLTLSNLGFGQRPDLVDSHTIHFHGFRDAIPAFDGVPEMSIAVPIGRDYPYFYGTSDPNGNESHPGTYMWHCHFEDVEHVHMGMSGVIYIRPRQNAQGKTLPALPGAAAGEKYVYNDAGDDYIFHGAAPGPLARSTRYDREYVMFLNELWAEAHFRDAHIQQIDFSKYHPDFWTLNGRSYPDTLQPCGENPALLRRSDLTLAAPAYLPPMATAPLEPRLSSQPISSLVQCNAGDRVLLRFVDLGFQQHAMTLAGIPMHVVGRDAVMLRGRDNTDLSYMTNTVYIGPGESFDAIVTAPAYKGPNPYDTYLLYNRKYADTYGGLPGQMTEVRVYPAGTLPAQDIDQPNDMPKPTIIIQ